MEEIVDTEGSSSLADKVQSQSRRRAPEDANDRIQFLAATLQIGARHGEIGAIQSRRREEECSILRVPELVLRHRIRGFRHKRSHWLGYRHWCLGHWPLPERIRTSCKGCEHREQARAN